MLKRRRASQVMPAVDLTVMEAVFRPRSVAVVGASTNPDSPGHDYVRSLLDFGYGGALYPVNPRATDVLGLRAYHRLRDVPGPVDFVISCIPAEGILDLVEECREKGAKDILSTLWAFGTRNRGKMINFKEHGILMNDSGYPPSD